jgi:hypothetical protein
MFSKHAMTPKPEALHRFPSSRVESEKQKSWTKKKNNNFFFKNPIQPSNSFMNFQNMKNAFHKITSESPAKSPQWGACPINIEPIKQKKQEEMDLFYSLTNGIRRNPTAFSKFAFSTFENNLEIKKLHTLLMSQVKAFKPRVPYSKNYAFNKFVLFLILKNLIINWSMFNP